MSLPIVRVRDVFVAFAGGAGPVMALRGADLSLAPGERLLVQGPNGSGKSTLLRVITGEQPVIAGTVEVGGTLLHDLDPGQRRKWRARAVGFIDQHARRGLLPEHSVVNNVSLQLRLTGTGAAAAHRQAQETLARLGLENLAARAVGELSGGEAQRVATCAAVAHRPRLVLADEPTGELDEKSAQQVYELLDAIAADGSGVILVSHDPRSAGFADRAVRIRDGRLAEQWRPGDPGDQPWSQAVEQVPDSRGWIRLPVDWLISHPPPDRTTRGFVAHPHPDGLLLRRPVPDPSPSTPRSPGRAAAQAAHAPDQAAVAPRTTPDGRLVRLSEVTAGFGSRTVLSALDLELVAGRWLVVTGPSGSGKSTLLALVAGLLDPWSGAVSVAGTGWAGLDRTARARHRQAWLSMAPQRATLVEPLTVEENLRLSAEARGGLPTGAVPVIDSLDLSRLTRQPVSALSGGERQRVALARCLVTDAPVLVLDEPTSQQDDASADLVVAALRRETGRGRAVLVATHDPRLIALASEEGAELQLGHGPPRLVQTARVRSSA